MINNSWIYYAYGRDRVAELEGSNGIRYFNYDHLGSVRVVYDVTSDCSGSAVTYKLDNMSDYYAFGKTLRTFNTSKYQFTGKEHDKENNLEYFGARKYDADIARWISIDPMREKYPSLSPYNYAANNPVFFIDPDGRDIFPYHIMAIENRIGAMGKIGELSSATESAIKDIMKTENGLKFLSQFAKKGQTFAGHTFTEDGALSMHDLIIADWSLEKMDELFPTTLDGKFGVEYNKEGNKLTFKMELYTQAQSKYERGETYIHESTLHDLAQKYAKAFKEGGAEGFQKTYDQEQLSNPEGEKEHTALKNRDFSNAGYRKYSDLMMQLFKVNPFYVYPYNTAHDDAQKNIKKMRYTILYLITVAAVFFSCSDHDKIINQYAHSSKTFDSVVYKTELSGAKLRVYISFLKHGRRYEKFRQFVKTGDFYSEQYATKYYIKEDVDTVFIPTFIRKDTSFKKIFNYDNPSVMAPQGFYDWSYDIKKQSDGLFLLGKQNLTDTTWKEFFWYDKDFVIDRMQFINSGDTLVLGK